MQEYTYSERVLHRLREEMYPILAPIRRKKLINRNFTIISNNCWGGVCYEYFGLKKQTPTVGMYFFADEYIRFLSNLKDYLNKEINVCSAAESKYYDELVKREQSSVLVGFLGDVEFVLLHYHDKKSAIEKWKRRVNRINWDNMIYKFSYMNNCKDEHIKRFEEIAIRDNVKHFEFVPKEFPTFANAIVIPSRKDGQIGNDTFYWNKYINVVKFLNFGYK